MTPEGDDVPPARQIVLEFNRPVVPVGRMDRTAAEVGVGVTPALNCQWRWLNTSTLACNLNDRDAMRPATKYAVTVSPVIKAEDGGGLAEAYTSDFTTARPDSTYASFGNWRGPTHPVIRVTFNQPVTKSSVAAHLYLSVSAPPAGLPDQTWAQKILASFMPAHPQPAASRIAVTVSADQDDETPPTILPVPGEKKVALFSHRHKRPVDDQKSVTPSGEEARRVWMIEPAQELPQDSPFAVMQEAGLVSALGPEPGIDRKGPVVEAETFPALRFVTIRCWGDDDQEVDIAPGGKQDRPCNPLRSVSLGFSVPVLRSQVKANTRVTPDLANGRKDYNPWGDENRDDSQLDQPYEKDRIYYVGLPMGLKAAHGYSVHISGRDEHWDWFVQKLLRSAKPVGMEDQFGRVLARSVTIDFATAHRNPNFEMPAEWAVLEKNVESDVTAYVDNLTSFSVDYSAVKPGGDSHGQQLASLPKVSDIQFAVPVEARKILKSGTGAFYGTVSTVPPIPGRNTTLPHLFAEVTPWQVHLKLGHFQSIAWVTDMASGQPVEGAKVTVYPGSFSALSSDSRPLGTALTDKDGLAILPGAQTLDPDQAMLNAWGDDKTRLFLRVDKGADMALLPLSHDFAIETWQAADQENLPNANRPQHGHLLAWGMTAQGVYKAGDTIQYKLFVRDQDNNSLVPAPSARYSLKIVDPMGKTSAKVKALTLTPFGTYAGEFQVPKTGAVGWYQFKLTADFTGKPEQDDDKDQADNTQDNANDNGDDASGDAPDAAGFGIVHLQPLRVLVSDFTPSPFAVSTEASGDHFRPGDTLTVDTTAKLHSGGAYGDASVRTTVMLESKSFTSSDPAAKGFTFDSYEAPFDSLQIAQNKAMLDAKGEHKESITLPQQKIVYGTLDIEGAVQDDRGKNVAAMAHADYAGVDRLVGLQSRQFVYAEKKPVAIPVIVVDDKGKPVKGVPVAVSVQQQVIDTVKVKGAGNAYLSDTTTNWKQISTCTLTSDSTAENCAFTPAAAGTYSVTASIKDTQSRPHSTKLELWVTGDDYVQWDDHSEDVLPIMPEKKEYHVGDTARFMVKNPYPGAKALVTVERYGVIDSFVRTLEGSTPIIEIPVTPDDLPGFYLSVTVVSPRVAKPLPGEGQVDLGKPAFRMGYVAITVRDPYKEMTVSVKTDQPVYRPRDTVKADLQAVPRFAPNPPQPVELAVAVVDEAVFDLIAGGRDAYDPYKGFYNLEPLDVRNYDLLLQLIGRRSFEKKGANPGGDGGKDVNMRNIFKYVSYWNPSVPVDRDGKAHIEFPAPDNLTGWHVLALAVTPGDRMGLGEGAFKVNRPTELRPVMPNQVHEGDSFAGGFSVMNRTDHARTLTVAIEAGGDLDGGGKAQSAQQTVTLQPYQRTTVNLNLKAALLPVERELPQGAITFKATAGDALDKDGLDYSLPVNKMRSFDVGANYATTTDDKAQEHIAFPKDIYTDVGDVSVVLSPSVIANLTGAFRYMRDYPYFCWEQILSKGVMAAHYTQLKSYLPASFTWPESGALPQQALDQASSFQAPNGGMSYFEPQDKYVDPYLSAYTAIAFRWLRKDGYQVPDEVESKLQDYLQTFLRKDVAPDFYDPGMSATVRAVALAALADAGKVDKDDVLRYEPALKDMTLFGKAHFLQAAATLGTVPDAAKEAADMIFATGSETGGKFMFNETHDDSYARILTTPIRDNCAVLDSFLQYGKDGQGKALIGDKPFKLVRSITQSRGGRDYWENTQENMFCMNALVDYARAYESTPPNMTVQVALDGQSFGQTSFHAPTDAAVTFSRPIQKTDPGRTAALDIDRAGQGRLYYATRLRYALTAPKDGVDAGFDIHREYNVKRDGKWALLKAGDALHQGDLVRVDLFLSLPAARNFVAVSDPVPGGLEPVNRDLATASTVDADAGEFDRAGGSMWFKFNDWREYNFSFWSFYHEELRHDAVRFFADRLEPGNYHLSYTAQAVAQGQFAIPPVRAEEMYDPDVYGTGASAILTVQP
jgi:uncharacterized protein YfaS (alpha-2-macroglobulin family)